METIFALSTPPGKSAVAVIRVSGPAARHAAEAFGAPLPAPRMAAFTALQDGAELLDNALVLFFPAPHSFTGEDVVEFHLHGSRAVIRRILALLATLPSFRHAEPGEFSRRAFLHGKMDLTVAEGLADLIDAQTEAQARQAARFMQGDAARFYEGIRARVVEALALLEAYIDFPDEEIPEGVLGETQDSVGLACAKIEAQLATADAAEKIREGVYVTILGPPNAGKSSLLNLLARRDAAIVSHIAGTTRDVIEVEMEIQGFRVILADTAGIREAVGSVEEEGILRALARGREADVTILVLSAPEPVPPGLEQLVDDRTLLLLNKADLGLPSPLPKLSGQVPLPVSVQDRTGMDALMEALKSRVADCLPVEAAYVTHARHRAHLASALTHLRRYLAGEDALLELRCEELRRAATEIGKITGVIGADELLGHIFSRFCIGK